MKIMKAVIARFYRTQHPLRDIQVPLGNQSKVTMFYLLLLSLVF